MKQEKNGRETSKVERNGNPVINQITAPSYFFKEILTTQEATEYMGISVSCLRGYIYTDKIPRYKPVEGGKGYVYFKKSELDVFMLRNRKSADYELEEKANSILNGESAGKKR